LPTPAVTICTENIAIPALGVDILFNGERLESPPEYLLHHLWVSLPLLIQPLLWNIAVLVWNRQWSDHYNSVP